MQYIASQRPDGGMEGLDASDVRLVSLLRRQGMVQLDTSLHRLLCLDDWLR